MKPTHSPLPWHRDGLEINQGGKWTSDQDDIAYINEEVGDADGFANRAIAEANAEFVFRACHAHYTLLEACKALLRIVEDEYGYVIVTTDDDLTSWEPVMAQARAAIAAANSTFRGFCEKEGTPAES